MCAENAETVRNDCGPSGQEAHVCGGIDEALRTHGFLITFTRGTSMMPFLKEGKDSVRLEMLQGPPDLCDVVLFRRDNGSLVLHRVVGKAGRRRGGKRHRRFLIQGDNCAFPETVPEQRILARMTGFYTERADAWAADTAEKVSARERVFVPADDPAYLSAVRRIYDVRENRLVRKRETPVPDNVWRPLVVLLRNALNGSDAPVPENADWENVYRLASRHSVASLVFDAVPQEVKDTETGKKWKRAQDAALRKQLLFENVWTSVSARLEEEKISFLPLKGMVIKDLYPKKGAREFADYDVLYDERRQDDVRRIMEETGFETVSLAGVHDVYHMEPVYNFEFHKRLFSVECPWEKAFLDVWDASVPSAASGVGRKMTDGYFYAYFIAHFWKHYGRAGSGLRSFADLHLLKKAETFSQETRESAERKLSEAGLSDAEKELSCLAELLFGDGTDVEKIPYDRVGFCLESGVYGRFSNAVRSEVGKRGKAGYFIRRAFPPMSSMRVLYPVLDSAPVLLPVCWCARAGKAVFTREKRERVSAELRVMKEIKSKGK